MEALSVAKNIRIMPNCFARSNLFSVSDTRSPRKYFDNVQVSSPKGITLYYKGEELRQDDADVFLALMFLFTNSNSKKETMTTEVSFLPKEIFQLMGWPYRNFYIDKLKGCLNRMKEGNFRYYEKFGITAISIFSYVHYPIECKDKSPYIVQVSNDIFKLFDNNFTKINVHTRLKLTPMARWLYSFYATHTEAYPHKVSTLKEYCGSTCKDMKNFRAILKSGFDELVEANFLHSFHFEKTNDLVHVRRNDVLKNSKDPYYSNDFMNVLYAYLDSIDKPSLDIGKIKEAAEKVLITIESEEHLLKMICRCLDEFIKYKKIKTYMLNKNGTITVIRQRES